MKKHILCICLLATSILNLNAQDYQWAFTTGEPSISNVAAIRKDHGDNFYLATQRDSSIFHMYSDLVKRDNSQQLLWSKQIFGDVIISDLEINSSNKVVVIGYYKDTLTIDGNTLINSTPEYCGFIFEADENGTLIWAHNINPTNNEFIPIELFIAQNGSMYISAEMTGVTNDFTSFHKLDQQGNIIKSKFNNDTQVRTYSNILADDEGNVYLSGTCGNFAMFDTIAANINYSYQNFVIKYDSSFTAQWFDSREYITFDNNNSLQTNGQSLFWACLDFNQNPVTVKIINIENDGTFISEMPGPMPQTSFPSILFSMDSTGNSVLMYEIYSRLILYRYDQSFNLTWEDTIMSGASGFGSFLDLKCYDSTFYLSSRYYVDTLQIGNFSVINQNQTANSPSDNFVTRWSIANTTSINAIESSYEIILIYPNPATSTITIDRKNSMPYILKVFDVSGRLLKEIEIDNTQTQINLSAETFAKGIYVFNFSDEKSVINKKVFIE